MSPATLLLIGKAIDLLIAGLTVVPAGVTEVRRMVAEGRDPTPAEFAALDALLDAQRQALHHDGPEAPTGPVPVEGATA